MRTYEHYNRAFAELVASSLALVTEHCRPKTKTEEVNLEKLRAGWSNRIKVLSESDNGRHEALEKGLGQDSGALVTQVNAIHEKWKPSRTTARIRSSIRRTKAPLLPSASSKRSRFRRRHVPMPRTWNALKTSFLPAVYRSRSSSKLT